MRAAKAKQLITAATISLLGIVVVGMWLMYWSKNDSTLASDPSKYLDKGEIASIQDKVMAAARPNMYLDQTEIHAIEANVSEGKDPWTTAYKRMIADARGLLTVKAYSVTKNGGPDDGHEYYTEKPYCGWTDVDNKKPDCRDGQINPNADRHDYQEAIALGKAMHDLGVAYSLTGRSEYADKALTLIDTWCIDTSTRMNPDFGRRQAYIELSITLPGLLFGADLIYNYAGWSASDKEAFEAWVRAMAESALGWHRANNFENWRVNFLASAGALLKDASLLAYAFGRYKQLIPHQINHKGEMIKELERTKSLSYSLYALNAMIQTAEIARHYGVNLYEHTVDRSRGLKKALDYHDEYAAEQKKWPYKQISPLHEDDNVALYELAYSYWQRPSYREVIDHWGRPMTERRILKHITLTHGDRFNLQADAKHIQ